MRRLSIFLVLIVTFAARAEYRAFLLKISTPPPQPGTEPTFRLVKSNLDPEQYPAYYPLHPNESIVYIDTWMCRGRTSEMKPICPSPREAQAPPPADPPPNQNP